MDNNALIKHLSPLSSIVNAAIIDTREDKGKVEQLFYHWGARGIKKLNTELFKSGKRRVLLTVNKSTHTATLPPDFDGELFVGYIDNDGYKVPIKHNNNLVNIDNIDEPACEDKCPKCNSNKSICNDLAITVETSTVTVNGTNYEQTVTKKMQPNGDYFLESNIPYFDASSGTVIYHVSKEFITHIDLKPCGCIDNTPANVEAIKICNPDVYCRYYAHYASTSDKGEYNIFPETGLIQLSPSFPNNKLYLEYRGFLLKVNGQYQVPSVAFETLVEWVKWKYIADKRNISRFDKDYQFNRYRIEKSNLSIVLTRTSLSRILNAILTTPKFDIFIDKWYSNCATAKTEVVSLPASADCADSSIVSSNPSQSVSGYIPYTLGVIAGMPSAPVDGSSVYQLDALKGAINLNQLTLNDTVLTLTKGDFTFDPIGGVIDISPNKFYTGDVLVGNYFKLV
jgi:hypothetical protein